MRAGDADLQLSDFREEGLLRACPRAFEVSTMPKAVVALFVVVIWIALSVAMMWPPVCRYGGKDAIRGVQGVYCINNLRQIDGAKQQFALETGRTNGPIDPAQLHNREHVVEPQHSADGSQPFRSVTIR